jgi:hypothetical protein
MYNFNNSNPQIRNTIFWRNTDPHSGVQIYNNGNTNYLSMSDSVVEGGRCPTGSLCTNIITADPLLGTLGNYGGFTQTIPLLGGSSAIDTGNAATCAPTDQRGDARPIDGDTNGSAICDIGAYEAEIVPLPTQTPTMTFTPTLTRTITATRTLTITPTLTLTDTVTLPPTQASTLTQTPTRMPPARTATRTPAITILSLNSIAAHDGLILESNESSDVGGSLNSSAAIFNLGDDAARRQYRGILSFSTGASLPDNAVLTRVILKIRQQAIFGIGDPVEIFQGFMVDIKAGFFGTSALQASDFQAPASKTVGPFNEVLVGGFYGINLTSGRAYINKLSTNDGLTQIRLRFKLDDNNDAMANTLSLYSGDGLAVNRPQLVITYVIP